MDDESTRIPSERPVHSFLGDFTNEVIGAFYEVYNILRCGYLESVYAGAMHLELLDLGLPVEREVPLPVTYKGRVVGVYRADMIVGGRLVLELKSIAAHGTELCFVRDYGRVHHAARKDVLGDRP
jgi:GxxExxY protein